MHDIDQMDMLGYIKLKAWKSNNDFIETHTPKKSYIDKVWPGMQSNI